MKKLWLVVCVVSAVAVVSACGSKKSSGGAAGAGATAGTTGATAGTTGGGTGCATFMGRGAPASGASTCNACLMTNCNTELTAAYGPNWASGDTSGGSCSALISCAGKCSSCADTTCVVGCVGSLTSDCQSGGQAVSTCQNSHCATDCGSSSTAGTGGGTAGTAGGAGTGAGVAGATGGKTCADLSACCATIADATQKQNCMLVASTNMDSACNSVYGVYSASRCM